MLIFSILWYLLHWTAIVLKNVLYLLSALELIFDIDDIDNLKLMYHFAPFTATAAIYPATI